MHPFQCVADYLYELCGMSITTAQLNTLAAKTAELMELHKIRHSDDLVRVCRQQSQIRQALVNAVTVNESYFFRDPSLWQDIAERVFNELLEDIGSAKQLNILHCACSHGQEVYSMAILVNQHSPRFQGFEVHVECVDIDSKVLTYAKMGEYSEVEMARGVSTAIKERYFNQYGNKWRIDSRLKQGLHFALLNLKEKFVFPRRFDLIFCRNVLIYMDVETKKLVLDQLAHNINNDGFLIIGGCETIIDVCDKWLPRKLGRHIFYQKKWS